MDLGLSLPPVDTSLSEIDHPLIKKANEQFRLPTGPRERIRSIDAGVWFKVKIQRWRGAVLDEGEPGWLVAAGIRESGSPDDFYESLATTARAARARYNAERSQSLKTDTCCQPWLPTADDHDRYRAEYGIRLLHQLRCTVRDLLVRSLLDGHEHSAEIIGSELGIQVRGDEDRETYVALRIVGSVPDQVLAVVLDLVPGCDRDGWYPEFAMPNRQLRAGEMAYSNIMDPKAAAQLLQDRDVG
ncbi:MAG TPA: hypothetical protein VGM75_19525 [Pseudonocardiaceae bacterium]